MKIVSLDVHKDASQLTVVSEQGELLLEMIVPTQAEALRAVIGGIAGPKKVVFEEGPLSGMIHDAVKDRCEEVVSCDPAHNALIAKSEDSNDQRDSRRLATLAQLKAVRPVYVPEEPYRTMRSLVVYDHGLMRSATMAQNRIQALCRRQGLSRRSKAAYCGKKRQELLDKLSNPAVRWQMESLFRVLDQTRRERINARRVLGRWAREIGVVERLKSIPGVGPITARTLVAWIADPSRFKSRNARSSYAGLGLGQGWTAWKPVSRARASKRGNREVKRVLFLAAEAATKSQSRLAERYAARLRAGWKHDKAIRDLARTILEIACALWRNDLIYDDRRVTVPTAERR